MEEVESPASRGYRHYEPGHARGASFDDLGPSLGPIRRLQKTATGFSPRALDDLEAIMGATFGKPVSCKDLMPGLQAVARAFDDGDMCRAIIATQFLRLPLLSEQEAQRAAAAEALRKASPDDPTRPGWPAKTPDGRGGKFRPKTGGGPGAPGSPIRTGFTGKSDDKLQRLITRRAIRAGLRSLLTLRRLGRFAVEAGSNVVPGLDVIGDAAMAADLVELTEDFEELAIETRVAQAFAEKGPWDLEDLLVSSEDETFPSFDAFKKSDLEKRFGPAGEGYDYHHIVEQSADGLSQDLLQSTKNIIRIPKLLHEEITSGYARKDVDVAETLRNQLRGQSFDARYREGLNYLRRIGILK